MAPPPLKQRLRVARERGSGRAREHESKGAREQGSKGVCSVLRGKSLFTSVAIALILTVHGARCTVHAISDNAGAKNGDFLRIGTDARGVALGDSVVSMTRGADALRWNQAALGVL